MLSLLRGDAGAGPAQRRWRRRRWRVPADMGPDAMRAVAKQTQANTAGHRRRHGQGHGRGHGQGQPGAMVEAMVGVGMSTHPKMHCDLMQPGLCHRSHHAFSLLAATDRTSSHYAAVACGAQL